MQLSTNFLKTKYVLIKFCAVLLFYYFSHFCLSHLYNGYIRCAQWFSLLHITQSNTYHYYIKLHNTHALTIFIYSQIRQRQQHLFKTATDTDLLFIQCTNEWIDGEKKRNSTEMKQKPLPHAIELYTNYIYLYAKNGGMHFRRLQHSASQILQLWLCNSVLASYFEIVFVCYKYCTRSYASIAETFARQLVIVVA